jgi:probable phosphoglycerate mutase
MGIILEDPRGRTIAEVGKGIGWATNNVAEYRALIEGLNLALSRGVSSLNVVSDSVLVVQQMSGNFKVRSAGLRPLHLQARDLARRFGRIAYESVPREANSEADLLANRGIDEWIAGNPDFVQPEPPQPELF